MNEDMLIAAMAPRPPLTTTHAALLAAQDLSIDAAPDIQQATAQLQPATGQVLSPPSLIEGGPSGDFHRIQMVLDQQPDRGKATSSTDRVQHFLDPPPIIRLELQEQEGDSVEDLAILTNPYLICIVYLEAPSETAAHTAKCGIKNVKERFWGGLSSWVTRVNNTDRHPTLPTAYMVWPTLMIKEPGTYRLHFELCMMSPQHTQYTIITMTDSEPFAVHGHTGFPGYGPSTDLTMKLYHAKVKLKVRPESKTSKKQKVAHQNRDLFGTTNDVEQAQNLPMPVLTPVAAPARAPRSRAKKPRQNKPSNGVIEPMFAFPGQSPTFAGLNNNGFAPSISQGLPSTDFIPMDGFRAPLGAAGLPYTSNFGNNHNMWDSGAGNNFAAGFGYGMGGTDNNTVYGSPAGMHRGFGPAPSSMVDCSAALAPPGSMVATRRPKACSNPQRIPTLGSRPTTPHGTHVNTDQIKTEYLTNAGGVPAVPQQLSSTSVPPSTMPFQPVATFNFMGAQDLPLDHPNNTQFNFSESEPMYRSELAVGTQSNPSIFPDNDDNDMSTDASDNDLSHNFHYSSMEWQMPLNDMGSQVQNNFGSKSLSNKQMEQPQSNTAVAQQVGGLPLASNMQDVSWAQAPPDTSQVSHLTMGQDPALPMISTELSLDWFDELMPPPDSQDAALQSLSITPPDRSTPNTPRLGSAARNIEDGANQAQLKHRPSSESHTITPDDEASAAVLNMLAAYSQ
ncbi:Velvet factor [Microdochium nivale]|nr:Velvet factor [Microdochium nivale]